MRESQVWFLQCLLSLSLLSISRMLGCDLAATVGGDRKRQTVYCKFLTPVFTAQCWSYFGKVAQTYSEVFLFTSPREHFIPSMSGWMLPPLRPLAQLRRSRLQASSLLYQMSYTWTVLCCDGVYCLSATLGNFLTLMGDIFIKPPGCGWLHADSYLNRQTGNVSLRHSALSTLKGCEQVKMKKPHFLLTCMNQIVINTGLAGKTQPLEYLLMISSLL